MPVITKPNQHFDVTTYTGNGANNRTISSNLTPDLVWMKDRTNAYSHILIDSIRGTGRYLATNTTNNENWADNIFPNSGPTTDGFIVDGGLNVSINANGDSYVAWQWKAASANTTNTDGSITSTVRANQTAGFSVVTYTGSGSAATVGHGLGATPKMIIIKNRDNATYDWNVYHANLSSPTTLKLYLNTSSAETNGGNNAGTWNSSAPSSTVFNLGTFLNVNESGNKFVAYCFAEVAGYSAFGGFTGNGSTDGPFVYLGFRPAFIMIKRTNSGDSWFMFDNKRETFNPNDSYINANTNNAEDTNNNTIPIDFVSNGFKNRGTSTGINGNGSNYIYMAFAEAPTKYANAR